MAIMRFAPLLVALWSASAAADIVMNFEKGEVSAADVVAKIMNDDERRMMMGARRLNASNSSNSSNTTNASSSSQANSSSNSSSSNTNSSSSNTTSSSSNSSNTTSSSSNTTSSSSNKTSSTTSSNTTKSSNNTTATTVMSDAEAEKLAKAAVETVSKVNTTEAQAAFRAVTLESAKKTVTGMDAAAAAAFEAIFKKANMATAEVKKTGDTVAVTFKSTGSLSEMNGDENFKTFMIMTTLKVAQSAALSYACTFKDARRLEGRQLSEKSVTADIKARTASEIKAADKLAKEKEAAKNSKSATRAIDQAALLAGINAAAWTTLKAPFNTKPAVAGAGTGATAVVTWAGASYTKAVVTTAYTTESAFLLAINTVVAAGLSIPVTRLSARVAYGSVMVAIGVDQGSSGLSGGAIAGIVIGVLVVVGLIVGVIFMMKKK